MVDVQLTGIGWLHVEIVRQRFSPDLAECDVARTTVEISEAATKNVRKDRIESSLTE